MFQLERIFPVLAGKNYSRSHSRVETKRVFYWYVPVSVCVLDWHLVVPVLGAWGFVQLFVAIILAGLHLDQRGLGVLGCPSYGLALLPLLLLAVDFVQQR